MVVEHATAERQLQFDEEAVVHATFNPSTYRFSNLHLPFYHRPAVRLEQFHFVT